MHSSTSIAIRFRNSIAVGFIRFSPSEMVGNSRGSPPAWRTPRLTDSACGPRTLCQYLLAGEGEALLVDAGTSATPRDAILPALRHVRIPVESVRFVVVTHPDLDHQGGLAGLKAALPRAIASCGFAD